MNAAAPVAPGALDAFSVRIVSGVHAFAAGEWDALFPGEAESAAYYAACEAARPKGFRMAAAGVYRGDRLVAATPLFRIDFRLDMPLQGKLKPIGAWLTERLPRLMIWPVLGFGSPLAERCHLGFLPELTAEERTAAARALLAGVEAHARKEKIGLVAIKDLADPDKLEFDATIASAGYSRSNSLPVAALDLPFADDAAYLNSLSSGTRKDIRRKLKAAGRVRIEARREIGDVEGKIKALYAETRSESGLDYGDFEELPEDYFGAVMRALHPNAICMLYWVGDELAAINLLLIEKDRVIDKFIGMRYALSREHNLYFISWMENVRFCIAQGVGRLQTGQTAYAAKLRLGSRLLKSHIYFRHRNPVANGLLRLLSRFIAFDQMDPDLKGREL